MEDWLLWFDTAHSPAENMALDEALLLTAQKRKPVLRFYSWNCPSVSIGYVQRYSAAPFQQYSVVRRPTGGGIVYHDHDLTYTVALPAEHQFWGLDRMYSYNRINEAVLAGLQICSMKGKLADSEKIHHTVDRETMVCFTNPTKYDILMGKQKIAGSAQRRTKQGILHQGSIHFGEALPVPRQDLCEAIADGFEETIPASFEDFQPEPELLALACELVTDKYSTEGWNQRR